MGTNQEAAGRPLFTIDGAGWLQYAPLKNHRLPELVYANPDLDDDETDAVFVRRNRKGRSGSIVLSPVEASAQGKRDDEAEVMFRRRLFRLSWAGMHDRRDDSLPCELLLHWDGRVADAARKLLGTSAWARMPMADVVRLRSEDKLLHVLPETVAYHVAVASGRAKDECPVGNLPGPVVRSVVDDARFALDANYHAAATYLKWLAETHWQHPLLYGGGFDTAVRERLTEVSAEATRLYFYMIGDTLYDDTSRYYARGALSEWWAELACYLFWIGRTGMGVYERLAGWPDRDDQDRWARFTQEVQGLAERVQHYSRSDPSSEPSGETTARHLAHVGGQSPCTTTSDTVEDESDYLVCLLPELEKLLRDQLGEAPHVGLSARAIVEALYPPDGTPAPYQGLRDCIEKLTRCRIGCRPDGLRLAKYMARQRGRTVEWRQLQRGAPEAGGAGPIRWFVRRVGAVDTDA